MRHPATRVVRCRFLVIYTPVAFVYRTPNNIIHVTHSSAQAKVTPDEHMGARRKPSTPLVVLPLFPRKYNFTCLATTYTNHQPENNMLPIGPLYPKVQIRNYI